MKTMLLAAMIGAWATSAIAHSPLKQTTPADADVIAEAPSEIVLDFKSSIRLTRVSLTFADTPNVDLDLGDQTSFTQVFVIPLTGMGPGNYVIDWRGLGDDGHAQNGTFGFTVE